MHPVRVQRLPGDGGGLLYGLRPRAEDHRAARQDIRPRRLVPAGRTTPAPSVRLERDAGRECPRALPRPPADRHGERRGRGVAAVGVGGQPAVWRGRMDPARLRGVLRRAGRRIAIRAGLRHRLRRPAGTLCPPPRGTHQRGQPLRRPAPRLPAQQRPHLHRQPAGV